MIDRLQDAQAHLRQAVCPGAERLRIAAAPVSPRHGARHGRRQARRELRDRHRRRGDLDQPRPPRRRSASRMPRRIPLKVWGTSGWEQDAFLLPGVDLAFDAIQYKNFPVVVLNLDAPSALLGFQLGGIVGHKFLKQLPGRHRSRAQRPAAQERIVAFLARRAARRAWASLQICRSSSVSTSNGGTRTRAPSRATATNVR